MNEVKMATFQTFLCTFDNSWTTSKLNIIFLNQILKIFCIYSFINQKK